MTISPPLALLGSQTPRLLNVPPRVSSAGREATELAASAGLILDDWQAFALDQALGERADGKWAAFEVGLVVPRQNGKGSVLEARELAGLFLFGERLIIHSAHEFKTAKEAFYRMRPYIENTPDLAKRVKQIRQSNEEVSIELKTGARLRYLARNNGGGRGFSGDCVILDEAFALQPGAMAALLPTMSAKSITGNPQIWYTSSAGMATSTVLASLRARRGDSARLCYMEWSAPDEALADLGNPEHWALSNPGLGIRIDPEFVQSELDAMRDVPLEFARERLGIWDQDSQKGVIPLEHWQAIVGDDVVPSTTGVTFGVAVTPERSWAALVAVDPQGAVEVVDHQPGTAWVVAAAAERAARWNAPVALAGPATSLKPDLENLRVRVVDVGAGELGRACSLFHDRACDHALRVRRHSAMEKAIAGARKRAVGDSFVWDRKSSDGDVSALEAATVALWVSVSQPPAPTAGFHSLADFLTDDDDDEDW